MMNAETNTVRCTDCGVQLEPDEAESATDDGKPRCDAHYHERQMARIDARPPRHLRFWRDTHCEACGHEFMADTTALEPASCDECGHINTVARPPQYRTARLLKAAHSHLTSAGATLSTLRRERAAGK